MRILSMRRGGVSHFYHADGLGSIRQLTDSTQTVTDTYLYKAFGELVTSTGTTINPLRYVGQVNYYDDGTSGLMLLGRRYYNCLVGRFETKDPIYASINWYTYGRGNPVILGDPTGMLCKPMHEPGVTVIDMEVAALWHGTYPEKHAVSIFKRVKITQVVVCCAGESPHGGWKQQKKGITSGAGWPFADADTHGKWEPDNPIYGFSLCSEKAGDMYKDPQLGKELMCPYCMVQKYFGWTFDAPGVASVRWPQNRPCRKPELYFEDVPEGSFPVIGRWEFKTWFETGPYITPGVFWHFWFNQPMPFETGVTRGWGN